MLDAARRELDAEKRRALYIAAQDYLGVEKTYYEPTDRGLEGELGRRLAEIRRRLRDERPQAAGSP